MAKKCSVLSEESKHISNGFTPYFSMADIYPFPTAIISNSHHTVITLLLSIEPCRKLSYQLFQLSLETNSFIFKKKRKERKKINYCLLIFAISSTFLDCDLQF